MVREERKLSSLKIIYIERKRRMNGRIGRINWDIFGREKRRRGVIIRRRGIAVRDP